jgi:hypothetical protein
MLPDVCHDLFTIRLPLLGNANVVLSYHKAPLSDGEQVQVFGDPIQAES